MKNKKRAYKTSLLLQVRNITHVLNKSFNGVEEILKELWSLMNAIEQKTFVRQRVLVQQKLEELCWNYSKLCLRRGLFMHLQRGLQVFN